MDTPTVFRLREDFPVLVRKSCCRSGEVELGESELWLYWFEGGAPSFFCADEQGVVRYRYARRDCYLVSPFRLLLTRICEQTSWTTVCNPVLPAAGSPEFLVVHHPRYSLAMLRPFGEVQRQLRTAPAAWRRQELALLEELDHAA